MVDRPFADRRAALIGAALLCAAAAGCTAGPPAPEDGGPPRPVATAAERGAPPPSAAQEERETAAIASRAAPVIDPDPKRLEGKDASGLAAMLGRPDFSRIDGPATLLRWRNERCILDAFLYAPDGRAGAARRVDHVEARDANGKRVAVRDCFAALLRARAENKG